MMVNHASEPFPPVPVMLPPKLSRGGHPPCQIQADQLKRRSKLDSFASGNENKKMSLRSGFFRRFFGWLAFYFANNLGISIFLRVFMIYRVCILLDLYFMSEMRSGSVSIRKDHCTKSVHVQILYIIRVILLIFGKSTVGRLSLGSRRQKYIPSSLVRYKYLSICRTP